IRSATGDPSISNIDWRRVSEAISACGHLVHSTRVRREDEREETMALQSSMDLLGAAWI
ncbi:Os01g0313666, partial [Oryza sativa Japonica Group]